MIAAVGGFGAAPAGADDVASAQRRANAAAAALAEANTELAVIEDDIVKVEADQAATEAELATLRTVVQETVVRSYVHAGGADVPYLLGGDLNAEARANALARFVTMGSFDQIDRYRALNEDLQSGAQLLAQRKDAQTAAVAQLTAKRQAANEELARLQALLRKRQQEEAARRAKSSSGRGCGRTPNLELGSLRLRAADHGRIVALPGGWCARVRERLRRLPLGWEAPCGQ